jgi:hypothetical protein
MDAPLFSVEKQMSTLMDSITWFQRMYGIVPTIIMDMILAESQCAFKIICYD